MAFAYFFFGLTFYVPNMSANERLSDEPRTKGEGGERCVQKAFMFLY